MDWLFAPYTAEEFLQKFWGEKFVRFNGSSTRFSKLMDWETAERILQMNPHPAYSQIRAIDQGSDKELYYQYDPSLWKTPITWKELVPIRINTTELYERLRNGASITLNHAESFHPPLLDFIEDLEKLIHENLDVQVWLAFGRTLAVDWHVDPDDQFILQVDGRKKWSVASPCGVTTENLAEFQQKNREYLKRGELNPAIKNGLVWTGILEAGQALYLPRNWLHLVTPLGEPSLHLTVGVSVTDGVSLLDVLREKLKKSDVFQQRLPRFRDHAEQKNHRTLLFETLAEVWNDGLFEKTLALHDQNAVPAPRFSLREAVYPENFLSDKLDDEKTFFRWLPVRWRHEQKGTSLVIATRGQVIELDDPLSIALVYAFFENRRRSLKELVLIGSEKKKSRMEVIRCLGDFTQHGLLLLDKLR